jgi:hypothetical protein
MDSATRFTYIGPSAYAGALAAALEAEGLSAKYEAPFETRDLGTAMNAVAVAFAVTGSLPEIVSTVRTFSARFPSTQVEGLTDEPRRNNPRAPGNGRQVTGRGSNHAGGTG